MRRPGIGCDPIDQRNKAPEAEFDSGVARPLRARSLIKIISTTPGPGPVSRPAVSQHLKVLKDAGLVIERAVGTRRIYRLNPSGVSALRDQLDAFWTRALASYKDLLEQPTEERS